MFYIKNIPGWERALRVIMGMAALAVVYESWGFSNAGIALGVMGLMLAMTGVMGYCPMCAMAGRKIDGGH